MLKGVGRLIHFNKEILLQRSVLIAGLVVFMFLVSLLEAGNGIIMFGWTTALVAAVIQRLAPARPGQHDADQ